MFEQFWPSWHPVKFQVCSFKIFSMLEIKLQSTLIILLCFKHFCLYFTFPAFHFISNGMSEITFPCKSVEYFFQTVSVLWCLPLGLLVISRISLFCLPNEKCFPVYILSFYLFIFIKDTFAYLSPRGLVHYVSL